LSLYRVHFKWKEKEVRLSARKLDLTHPYFVSIKEIVFSGKQSLIFDPQEDELKHAFSDTDHLMIPFQTVTLIEELTESETAKIHQFPNGNEGRIKKE
jgi:hypothetical protein